MSDTMTASGKNTQVEAYKGSRDLKEHDQQLLQMVLADNPGFNGSFLDIGCAAGVFIEAMHDHHPDASYFGFDTSEDLIEMAKSNLNHISGSFEVADADSFKPSDKYDILIASGVLSIWEDFAIPLEQWLGWMAESGTCYIFGRFNSAPIDTIVRFRNHKDGSEWEGGLTSYSLDTITDWLKDRGFSAKFERFHLSLNLKKSENPIRTYTAICDDGSKLVLNGANTVAEHYFLKIEKM